MSVDLPPAVPAGLRARLAGRSGWDTVCLPVGELRVLVDGFDERGTWAAETMAERDALLARVDLLTAALKSVLNHFDPADGSGLQALSLANARAVLSGGEETS